MHTIQNQTQWDYQSIYTFKMMKLMKMMKPCWMFMSWVSTKGGNYRSIYCLCTQLWGVPEVRSSAEILFLTSIHVSSVLTPLSSQREHLFSFISSLTASVNTEKVEPVLCFFWELLVLNFRFFCVVYKINKTAMKAQFIKNFSVPLCWTLIC